MIWDQRYASADYVYGTDPNEFLAETIRGLNGGGRALCLAEGEGRNAVFLARQGYEVHAVDASAVGLVKAERLARERGVHIVTEVANLDGYLRAEQEFQFLAIHCCPTLDETNAVLVQRHAGNR